MRYEKYDAKADLWSVGAIAYEMVFGAPPFRADNHVHLLRVIESSEIKFPSSFTFKQPMRRSSSNPSTFAKDKQAIITVSIETSDTFRDLLMKLLKKDPNKRISFEEYFSHPFICGNIVNNTVNPKVIIPSTPPLASSRSTSISATTITSTIDEVLKLEDDPYSLLDVLDNLKPPVSEVKRLCP